MQETFSFGYKNIHCITFMFLYTLSLAELESSNETLDISSILCSAMATSFSSTGCRTFIPWIFGPEGT